MRLKVRKFKFKETFPMSISDIEIQIKYGYSASAWAGLLEIYKSHFKECIMKNVRYSRDITCEELFMFLKRTRFNFKRFVPGKYECRNFAVDLHNKAEKAGIRTGVVAIEFKNKEEIHIINVFDTIDRGFMFIDCTGIRRKHTVDYTKVLLLNNDRFLCGCYLFSRGVFITNNIVKRYAITW